MMGCPGVGKTTTAHRIRLSIANSRVLSRDWFRKPDITDGSLNDYAHTNAATIDHKFYTGLKKQISKYNIVILDATFRERTKRKEVIDFAQRHRCHVLFIECVCSYEVQLERLNWQWSLGHKHFVTAPEEVLDYYINSAEAIENELNLTTVIQLDTENNQIILKSLQEHSWQLAEQLIKILEQPFDPL